MHTVNVHNSMEEKNKKKSIFVASYKGIITTVYKVIIVRNEISGIACTFKLKVHD